MPVLEKNGYRVLFIHIPKCGGHSLEEMFRTSGWQVSYRNTRPGNHIRITPQHYHANILDVIFDMRKFDSIFTVVRNPYDRFVSEYKFRNRKKLASGDALDMNAWARKAIYWYQNNNSVFDNHLRPQYEFVLPKAKIYPFENLSHVRRDYLSLADPDLLELPHLNEGSVMADEHDLDDEIKAKLGSFYKKDLILWRDSLAQDFVH